MSFYKEETFSSNENRRWWRDFWLLKTEVKNVWKCLIFLKSKSGFKKWNTEEEEDHFIRSIALRKLNWVAWHDISISQFRRDRFKPAKIMRNLKLNELPSKSSTVPIYANGYFPRKSPTNGRYYPHRHRGSVSLLTRCFFYSCQKCMSLDVSIFFFRFAQKTPSATKCHKTEIYTT